jgi:signal transduction histidine kinase
MRWPARRGWLLVVLLAAFQLAGSFGAARNQPDRRGIDALAVVLLLVGPVALAWRHRHPTTAALTVVAAVDVYIAGGYPYGPIFVSVAIAFFHLAIHRPRRVSAAVASLAFVGYITATLVDPRHRGGLELGPLALVCGWLVVIVVVSELASVRRAQVIQRRHAHEQERRRRLGEQRLELAQELHDVLAHNISLINVQASVALHLMESQPDRVEPALATIKQASHEALGELRVALDVLRRGEVAPRTPAPTIDDVGGLVDSARSTGLDITFDVVGEPAELSAACQLAAYRIVQEALTNVTRHARAGRVDVRLTYDDGITIDVVDDGVGGKATPGNGITGMSERAGAVGGAVDAGPLADGGFRVHAHLPRGAA